MLKMTLLTDQSLETYMYVYNNNTSIYGTYNTCTVYIIYVHVRNIHVLCTCTYIHVYNTCRVGGSIMRQLL